MRAIAIGLTMLLALGACGSNRPADHGGTALKSFDVAEEPAPQGPAETDGKPAVPAAAALPKIAYVYDYAFSLASDRIGAVEDAHVRLCDRLGPAKCQIVSMNRNAGQGEFVSGSLNLRVAASEARRFGTALSQVVAGAGGSTVSTTVSAEDLSKQMVDTEARLRAKEQLVARLLEILKTRTGTVAQLVEAERAIAQAQEELEAARSWLAEMQLRVATSTVEIEYASVAPMAGGFVEPVQRALGAAAGQFGQGLSSVISALAYLTPWAIAIAILVAILRALRPFRHWRWPRFRRAPRPVDGAAD